MEDGDDASAREKRLMIESVREMLCRSLRLREEVQRMRVENYVRRVQHKIVTAARHDLRSQS